MNLALPQTVSNYSTYAITLTDFIQPADERKVRQLFETMKTAWNTTDTAAFTACFTAESDFVNSYGEHLKNNQANGAAHSKLLKEMNHKTNLHIDIKDIRFITDEMAVVHAETAKLEEWERDISSCRLSYNTTVLVKENGNWKITSIHVSSKEKTGIVRKIVRWFTLS